jgi:hypothetical protein
MKKVYFYTFSHTDVWFSNAVEINLIGENSLSFKGTPPV